MALTLVTGRGSLPARMHPSLLLQPRANSPSWPAEPAAPANGDGAATAAPAPSPGTTVTATGGDSGGSFAVTTPGSGYLSQETCQQASRSGLIAAAGYTVGASLLGIVIFVVMRKRRRWRLPHRVGTVPPAARRARGHLPPERYRVGA